MSLRFYDFTFLRKISEDFLQSLNDPHLESIKVMSQFASAFNLLHALMTSRAVNSAAEGLQHVQKVLLMFIKIYPEIS